MPIPIKNSPEWLTELRENGYTVIKECIPREKALDYASRALRWVEELGHGFDRKDPTTRTKDKLHFFQFGGQTNRYGIAHEQFVWDVKQDPAVVDKFAEIWGTDELVVSFDGVNIQVPMHHRDPDIPASVNGAHVDQSPLVTDLYCVQGIVNLLPNGPDDGGLLVLKRSKEVYGQLFEAFDDVKPARGWNMIDRHDHSREQLQWLYDQGCEWEKVCCGPGDLILFDSRMVHSGSAPQSDNIRIALYCCYKPTSLLDEHSTARRKEAWEQRLNTTHDPITGSNKSRVVPDASHHTYQQSVDWPLQTPKLTVRGRQLVGLDPY